MYKKTITYTDYDGNERTEDFFFNLTSAEATQMELSTAGGLTKKLQNLVQKVDNTEIAKIFTWFIEKSYGVKSPDGRKFVKNPEVLEDFVQTEAYSKLFMELVQDPNAANEFFTNVIPGAKDIDESKLVALPKA